MGKQRNRISASHTERAKERDFLDLVREASSYGTRFGERVLFRMRERGVASGYQRMGSDRKVQSFGWEIYGCNGLFAYDVGFSDGTFFCFLFLEGFVLGRHRLCFLSASTVRVVFIMCLVSVRSVE